MTGNVTGAIDRVDLSIESTAASSGRAKQKAAGS
jgi:hypothetical protein